MLLISHGNNTNHTIPEAATCLICLEFTPIEVKDISDDIKIPIKKEK